MESQRSERTIQCAPAIEEFPALYSDVPHELQQIPLSKQLGVITFYVKRKDVEDISKRTGLEKRLVEMIVQFRRYVMFKCKYNTRPHISVSCIEMEYIMAINEILYEWFLRSLRTNITVDDDLIVQKGCQLQKTFNVDCIQFTKEWLIKYHANVQLVKRDVTNNSLNIIDILNDLRPLLHPYVYAKFKNCLDSNISLAINEIFSNNLGDNNGEQVDNEQHYTSDSDVEIIDEPIEVVDITSDNVMANDDSDTCANSFERTNEIWNTYLLHLEHNSDDDVIVNCDGVTNLTTEHEIKCKDYTPHHNTDDNRIAVMNTAEDLSQGNSATEESNFAELFNHQNYDDTIEFIEYIETDSETEEEEPNEYKLNNICEIDNDINICVTVENVTKNDCEIIQISDTDCNEDDLNVNVEETAELVTENDVGMTEHNYEELLNQIYGDDDTIEVIKYIEIDSDTEEEQTEFEKKII